SAHLRPPRHPGVVEFQLHLGGLHARRATRPWLLRASAARRRRPRRSRRPEGRSRTRSLDRRRPLGPPRIPRSHGRKIPCNLPRPAHVKPPHPPFLFALVVRPSDLSPTTCATFASRFSRFA